MMGKIIDFFPGKRVAVMIDMSAFWRWFKAWRKRGKR